MICVVCGGPFDLPTLQTPGRTSKRVTCSAPCRTSLAWRTNPEKRIASIIAERRTPEARARSTAANNIRWAQPGQRERLAEWNRKRWADPEVKSAQGRAIAAAWTPERRGRFAEFRRQQWATDAAYRAATIAGLRRALGSPTHRAMFSRLLKARWQDPVWRERWTEGTRRRFSDPQFRAASSERMKLRWQLRRSAKAVAEMPKLRFAERVRDPCSWTTEIAPRQWSYCDAPIVPGKPYCTEHCAIAYPAFGRQMRRSTARDHA